MMEKEEDVFQDLVLLADVAVIVVARPALLCSPLEVELRRMSARPGTAIKRKRSSLGAKRVLNKEAPVIAFAEPPPGVREKLKPRAGLGKRQTVVAVTKTDLPVAVRSKIADLCGTDVKLIMEKNLTVSDLNSDLGRLSIPQSLVLTDFLDREESRSFENRGKIAVTVIEPCLGVSSLTFKRWKMSMRTIYVLITGWNAVAHNESNGLRADDPIQLWSFRTRGSLGFAIVTALVEGAGKGYSPSSPSSVLTDRA